MVLMTVDILSDQGIALLDLSVCSPLKVSGILFSLWYLFKIPILRIYIICLINIILRITPGLVILIDICNLMDNYS